MRNLAVKWQFSEARLVMTLFFGVPFVLTAKTWQWRKQLQSIFSGTLEQLFTWCPTTIPNLLQHQFLGEVAFGCSYDLCQVALFRFEVTSVKFL